MRHTRRQADLMPRGSRCDETGWLNDDRGRLILRRDAGGTWQLDAPWRARRLVGQRVRVVGVRADFNVLTALSVEAI